MSKFKQAIVHPVVALLLSGCATASPPAPSSPKGLSTSEVRIAMSSDEPRLVVSWSEPTGCLVDAAKVGILTGKEGFNLVGALIAAIAPKIIDKGLDLAAARLRKAAEDQVHSLRDEEAQYLFRIERETGGHGNEGKDTAVGMNPSLRCLQVFGLADTDDTTHTDSWNRLSGALAKSLGISEQDASTLVEGNQLAHEGTRLLFLAELYLDRSAQNEALRLVPSLLYYGHRLDAATTSGGARSLVATVNMKLLGEDTFLSETIDLEKWTPPVLVAPPVMREKATPWVAAPVPPDAFVARAASVAEMSNDELTKALEKNEHLLAGGLLLTEVIVVETLEGKKWKAHVADILSESQAEVSTALSTALIPEKRAAAEQKEAVDALGLDQAFDLALIDEEIACVAWTTARDAGAADATAKWKALVQSRYLANIAAIKAGEPVPFAAVEKEDCAQ